MSSRIDVRDAEGRRVAADLVGHEGDGSVHVRWPDGRVEHIVAAHIARTSDDTVELRLPFAALAEGPEPHHHREAQDGGAPGETTRQVVPVVAEELEVATEEREGARVRVRTHVEEREEAVSHDLSHEHVEVRRVPIGRYVDEPQRVREEAGLLVVPVHEEVLVVEKRLLLKEEVHLTTRHETRRETEHVRLRRERADVERIEPDEA
jgi:stress response protein YsnF